MTDLANWTSRAKPARVSFEGRFVTLQPLEPVRHGDDLFAGATTDNAPAKHRYLPEEAPANRAAFDVWLEQASRSPDPLYWTALDQASGKADGRCALLRIDEANGVIEIGAIYWGPRIARRPAATEAVYLLARHVFDELRYRRLEWKCDSRNEPSRRAALRLGFNFEGIFRRHRVVKGENRDTAWYAMTDQDWPAIKAAISAWLDSTNFDERGLQRQSLQDCRSRQSLTLP